MKKLLFGPCRRAEDDTFLRANTPAAGFTPEATGTSQVLHLPRLCRSCTSCAPQSAIRARRPASLRAGRRLPCAIRV